MRNHRGLRAPNESGHPWTLWITDEDSDPTGAPSPVQEVGQTMPRPVGGEEDATTEAVDSMTMETTAETTVGAAAGSTEMEAEHLATPMPRATRKPRPHLSLQFVLPEHGLYGRVSSLCFLRLGEIGLKQLYLRVRPSPGGFSGLMRRCCVSPTAPAGHANLFRSGTSLDTMARTKQSLALLSGLPHTCPPILSSSMLLLWLLAGWALCSPSTWSAASFLLIGLALVIMLQYTCLSTLTTHRHLTRSWRLTAGFPGFCDILNGRMSLPQVDPPSQPAACGDDRWALTWQPIMGCGHYTLHDPRASD